MRESEPSVSDGDDPSRGAGSSRMTAPTTASTTSASTATPRSPALDLSPARAARELGAGRPCPVCGATLEPAKRLTRESPLLGEVVLSVAGILTAGLVGVAAAAWAKGRGGCDCPQCRTTFRNVPTVPTNAAALFFVLLVGALAGLAGVSKIQDATGARLVLAFAATIVGIASPFYAYVVVTRPWKHLAERIARARARWAEERKTGAIEVDAQALLAAASPGAACPVCDGAKLEGAGPNALWSRALLGCPRCRIEIPARLTPLGTIGGLILAAAVLGAGAYSIWIARDAVGNGFAVRAGVGLLLGISGLYLGFMIQGSGDDAARNELERGRRVFLRRLRGLHVRDEDEEPVVWFQENLEAVVVAFILALVIRHFVMEAFVIPTGSMAPTLLGDHFQVECKNCHYKFAVQKFEGRVSDSGEEVNARCPLCGVGAPENSFKFFTPDVWGGNKILVNKFIYKFEDPERYQVVVFKFPKNPTRNFIKRLVGLPGEYITIDARGDVWARTEGGTRHLAHKSASVQEELWFPVYDARWPDPRESAWRPEHPARWESRKGETGTAGETWLGKPGSGDSWLNYGREIKDVYGYNKSWGSGSKPVGDVRVRARVTPGASARWVRLATVENERALVAEIPVSAGASDSVATLGTSTGPGRTVLASGKVRALTPGVPAEIALGYADERLTLTVNGVTVFAWDDPTSPSNTETSSVRLGADAGGATFENVKVDRDIFYVPAHGSHPEVRSVEHRGARPQRLLFHDGRQLTQFAGRTRVGLCPQTPPDRASLHGVLAARRREVDPMSEVSGALILHRDHPARGEG